jgi:hypothetical protein
MPWFVRRLQEETAKPGPANKAEMTPAQMYGGSKAEVAAAKKADEDAEKKRAAETPTMVVKPEQPAAQVPPVPPPAAAPAAAAVPPTPAPAAATPALPPVADDAAPQTPTPPTPASQQVPPPEPPPPVSQAEASPPRSQLEQTMIPKQPPAAAPAAGATGAATPPPASSTTTTTTPATTTTQPAAQPGAQPAAPAANFNVVPTDAHTWLESRKGVESGGKADAKNPRSSASGYYGITDGTYNTIIANHPELRGQDKNSEAVATALFNDNKAALKAALGHDPTAHELNAAWLLGAGGASRALQADQNAPITNVVSGGQLAANPQWLNQDGSPKSIGQVLAEYDQGRGGGGGGGGTAVAAAPSATGGMPSAADAFAKISNRIDAYLASQPQLMAKLMQMQQDYLNSTKPSLLDQLSDNFRGWAMAQNAADANRFATTGGVIHKALPNPQPMQQALAAQQSAAQTAREQQLQRAGQVLGFGKDMAQLQATMNYQALGLSNELTKNMVDYGIQTGRLGIEAQKNAIELAKYGQEQAKSFSELLEKSVGDPATRAAVMSDFLASGGNPNAPMSQNLAALNGIIQKHVQAGESLSATPKYWDILYPDGQREVVDASTLPGRQKLEQVSKIQGVRATPQTTQNFNLQLPGMQGGGGGGGGTGEGGGSAPADPLEQRRLALDMVNAAKGAQALLPFIEKNGNASWLTGDEGTKINGVLKTLGLGDYIGQDARLIYNKLMQQVQLGLVLPQMKMMGARPAQTEFQQLMQGQLGSTAHTTAANAFLNHVIGTGDITARRIWFQIEGAHNAKLANNPLWDERYETMKWDDRPENRPPQWSDEAHKLIETLNAQKAGTPQPQGTSAQRAGANQPPPPPPQLPPGVTPEWKKTRDGKYFVSPDGQTIVDTMGVRVDQNGNPIKGGSS